MRDVWIGCVDPSGGGLSIGTSDPVVELHLSFGRECDAKVFDDLMALVGFVLAKLVGGGWSRRIIQIDSRADRPYNVDRENLSLGRNESEADSVDFVKVV